MGAPNLEDVRNIIRHAADCNSLQDYYSRLFGQLMTNQSNIGLARHIFAWMAYSDRPLSFDEVKFAYTFDPENKKIDETRLPIVEDYRTLLSSICASLVKAEPKYPFLTELLEAL
jgi:hypothetical protein